MGGFVDPSLFARTYRDPVAVFGLVIDLLPLIAIFVFGWGVDELVVYYWIENLIIGAGVWLRLLALGTVGGKRGAWFMMVFFPVHYGMFCLVHGMLLLGYFDPVFTAMPLFLAASLVWEGLLFWRYFIGDGEHRRAAPGSVMFSPYARIVIVHLAIFGAAFSAEAFGSPIGGALAILVLDVLWGVVLAAIRGVSRERRVEAAAV